MDAALVALDLSAGQVQMLQLQAAAAVRAC